MEHESMSVNLVVAAPAGAVFAVLADPTKHGAIDGTGWVRDAVDQAPLTEVGQIFRINMFHSNHPAGDYRMANRVEVLDAPRSISWQPGQENNGQLEFGGWIWRYDLAAIGPSTTEVTLSYDWSAVPQQIREYIQFPPFEPEHLTNSLGHLAELVASAASAGR